MTTIIKTLIGIGIIAVASAAADAAIISVSVTSSNANMAASDSAGAPGVRVDDWNNLGGFSFQNDAANNVLSNIKNDPGTATTLGVAFTRTPTNAGFESFQPTASSALTNDARMFAGHLDSNRDLVIDLKQIPYAQYDVYVYLVSGSTRRSSSVTDGTTTYDVRQASNNPSSDGTGYLRSTDTTARDESTETLWNGSIGQANYVRFENLATASRTITVKTGKAWDNVQRDPIAGFQIVEVPEPAALSVLGMGALTLVRRRRTA
jgi:hypothetical protein